MSAAAARAGPGGVRYDGRRHARGARRAGADVHRALRLRGAAVDADARAGGRAARRLRGARRRRRDLRPARWRAGCPDGRAPPAAVLVAIGALRARAAGRRRRRRAAAALTAGASWRPAIGRGIDALPGARVPYRGLDEWTRMVISARRHRARRRRRAHRVLAAPARARAAQRRARAAGRRSTPSRPSRSTSPRSSSRARCWRCSWSPTCGSSGCRSPTRARPASSRWR